MNKRQKLVQEAFLDNEEAVLQKLEKAYDSAYKDITKKTRELESQINELDVMMKLATDEAEKAQLLSMQQSKIYQKQYQDALKQQISSILDNLQVEEFKTVSEYLKKCYEDGFIGTMFDLQGQGIPLCFPLDQVAMVRAVQLDSKINKGLYKHLGEDIADLKKAITSEVSRGISTGTSFAQVAQQIKLRMSGDYDNPGGSLAYAMRIARTEGHRIQVQSGMDACYKAKDMGADVVKQWDSTLDKRTRKSHQQVDGEIRELDESFSNGLKFPGDPDGGAAEVVNCRCALLQRARWALDEDELETLKERAKYFELDKADTFKDYKKKYLDATQKILESPIINNAIISKAHEEFGSALKTSDHNKKHITKMKLYSEATEYVEDNKLAVPFSYDVDDDVIKFNTNAKDFELYDLNYVQAHELSHRIEVLEYDVLANKDFKQAIEVCKEKVLNRKEEIQGWFNEDGKYKDSFAISDIISALSNNEIEVPIGHENEYWENPENVMHEIFADISSIDVLDDGAKVEFDDLLKEVFDIYRGIIG